MMVGNIIWGKTHKFQTEEEKNQTNNIKLMPICINDKHPSYIHSEKGVELP